MLATNKYQNKHIFIIIATGVVIYYSLFITMFSGQPAGVSSSKSSAITKVVVDIIEKTISPVLKNTQTIDKQKLWKLVHHIIRKCAHFYIFALFGFSSSLLASCLSARNKVKITLSVALCGAFKAVADEIHQTFVPGRDGNLIDVLIDFYGVCSGLLVCFFVIHLIEVVFKQIKE